MYSVNGSYWSRWSEGQRRLVRRLEGEEGGGERFIGRYVGSLVADVRRTLLYGGIFTYPAESRNARGKLRLCYEVNPLAFICEQAGGLATDGTRDILDIQPESLHQRTPLYVGNREHVELARDCLAGGRSGTAGRA